MDTTIRNIDDDAYRQLKARAAMEGRTIGDLINDAIAQYVLRPAQFEKTGTMADIRTWDFGPGTERLSEQIDEILYDNPHGDEE